MANTEALCPACGHTFTVDTGGGAHAVANDRMHQHHECPNEGCDGVAKVLVE